jgi:hypothetical protein
LEQLRVHQHMHEMGAIRDGLIDPPSVCVGKSPTV